MNKVIKFEKENCPKCDRVENFLQGNGVTYRKIDIENVDSIEDMDYIARFVDFGLPVVVVLDGNNKEIAKVTDYNIPELEELVSKI
ncbi:glutaredoxin family protein [Bacillus sp. Wb]